MMRPSEASPTASAPSATIAARSSRVPARQPKKSSATITAPAALAAMRCAVRATAVAVECSAATRDAFVA